MCLQKGWKTRGSTPTPTASTSYFVWYVCVIIRYVNSVGCGTSEQVLKTFRRNTQASWGSISQQQHRILLHNLRCDAQQCKEFNLSLALRYNKRHWFRQCQWEIPLRWRRLAIRHTAPSTNKYSKKKKKIGIEKNVDRYWGSIMLAGRTTSRKRTAGLNADIKAHWIYERWEFNKLDAYLTKHNQHWIIFYCISCYLWRAHGISNMEFLLECTNGGTRNMLPDRLYYTTKYHVNWCCLWKHYKNVAYFSHSSEIDLLV